MEPQALEREAQSAIAAASTVGELDEVRVRYLGRKSALKQALRGVRDRETGMALNALRERLEDALAERHLLPRRRRRPPPAHLVGPDPRDGVAAAAALPDRARPLLPA